VLYGLAATNPPQAGGGNFHLKHTTMIRKFARLWQCPSVYRTAPLGQNRDPVMLDVLIRALGRFGFVRNNETFSTVPHELREASR
jgi:hypothetical protein